MDERPQQADERPQLAKRSRAGLWILLVLVIMVSVFWLATRWMTRVLLGTTPAIVANWNAPRISTSSRT